MARLAGLAGWVAGLVVSPVQAQSDGCARTVRSDPPGQVIVCADGLTIHAEADSTFGLLDRRRDGRPEAVRLDARGLLIEVPAGRGGGFQILTPHAIAAVRGTVWAVDVTTEQTSVFVRRGSVRVRRPGGRPVMLRAGDGVDVRPGSDPPVVQRWRPARVAALLARFGR